MNRGRQIHKDTKTKVYFWTNHIVRLFLKVKEAVEGLKLVIGGTNRFRAAAVSIVKLGTPSGKKYEQIKKGN